MGCPIRRSRDHRSLAAPPSFSQLATSFIACDAKVSTCALLLTYFARPLVWAERERDCSLKLHPHAHGTARTDRLHVWHMKVLHYAVFKDLKDVPSSPARSRLLVFSISCRFRNANRPSRVVPSKLSSAFSDALSKEIALQDTLSRETSGRRKRSLKAIAPRSSARP